MYWTSVWLAIFSLIGISCLRNSCSSTQAYRSVQFPEDLPALLLVQWPAIASFFASRLPVASAHCRRNSIHCELVDECNLLHTIFEPVQTYPYPQSQLAETPSMFLYLLLIPAFSAACSGKDSFGSSVSSAKASSRASFKTGTSRRTSINGSGCKPDWRVP